ncbi:MAG: hypothetical protein AAF514_04460 [Verrucomicrobiota bacterium]
MKWNILVAVIVAVIVVLGLNIAGVDLTTVQAGVVGGVAGMIGALGGGLISKRRKAKSDGR